MNGLITFIAAIVVIRIAVSIIGFVSENAAEIKGCLVVSLSIALAVGGCRLAVSPISVETQSVTRSASTVNKGTKGRSEVFYSSSDEDEAEAATVENPAEETRTLAYGSDITAGIYKIWADESDHSDKSVRAFDADSSTTIGEEEFRNTAYVEVKEGQSLEMSKSLGIVPIAEAEPADCPGYSHGYSLDGWYLIGLDLPPGKYTINWGSGNYSMYGAYDSVDLPWAQRLDEVGGVLYDSEPDIVTFVDGEFVRFSRCDVLIDPTGSTHKYEVESNDVQEEEPVQTQTIDIGQRTVYITDTGHRYHSNTHCRGLNNANETHAVTLDEAEDRGFTPCKICH